MREPIYKSIYSRVTPTLDFEPDQSLYDLVMSTNAENMDYLYASYFGKTGTYAQLKEATDKLASALVRDGVKPGDIVGVCVLTIPEVAEILLAINKIGAVSFWLDARSKHEDIVHYITAHNISHAIVVEPVIPNFMGIPGVKIVGLSAMNFIGQRLTPESAAAGITEYADFIESGGGCPIIPWEYSTKRPALIVQSSGSTGKSKAIVHSAFNLNLQTMKMSYMDLPFYKKVRALACVPPWIIYGLVNSIYANLVFGMQVVFTLMYKEDIALTNLGSYDVIFGVPVIYRHLYGVMKALQDSGTKEDLEKLAEMKEKIGSVRSIFTGGDKLPDKEHILWQLMFEQAIVNGYGNNEVVGAAIVAPKFANRPGAIGVPTFDTLVKTYDADTDSVLPDGQVGEVIISTDAMFLEYLDNPEETREIKRMHEGRWWVHTGDLGYITPDGYIYLMGRTKRLIIDKMGYKIAPENSENYIQKLPHVRECAVVGADLAENDKVPFCFLELDTAEDTEAVIAAVEKACAADLKDYERPRFFEILDPIPHNTNGKRDYMAMEKLAQDIVDSRK